jgi:hypothetical protein
MVTMNYEHSEFDCHISLFKVDDTINSVWKEAYIKFRIMRS